MSNKALTLSIVIPVYNEEDYLAHCLDAVFAQSIKPDEVIVVDNNSTDNSVQIAKTYPTVTVIFEKTPGVQAARDKGFNIVKNDIIARIDADTVLPVDWVAKLKKNFVDNSVVAITGPVSYYDMPLPRLNYWFDHMTRKSLHKFAPSCPFLFGSNMAIRTDIWKLLRTDVCHDKKMHEDLDLAIHLKNSGHRIVYDKYIHTGASARRYDDSLKHFLQYGKMFRDSYRNHGINSVAPYFVTSTYTAGYLLFRSARRIYDPKTQNKSLKHALTKKHETARKNPMA